MKYLLKPLFILLICFNKQICATETNKFARLFCDKGLCAGGTEEITRLNTIIKERIPIILENLEFKEGVFWDAYLEQRVKWDTANTVFIEARLDLMEQYNDIGIKFNFLCLFALLTYIYYSNRKGMNLLFSECYTSVKQHIKQGYLFFNRLLFSTNTAKHLNIQNTS